MKVAAHGLFNALGDEYGKLVFLVKV
jgi:hypothetical protein